MVHKDTFVVEFNEKFHFLTLPYKNGVFPDFNYRQGQLQRMHPDAIGYLAINRIQEHVSDQANSD